MVWNDVRYALRWLRKSPGFAVVAALTLAIGIGANTAIFSVVHAVLLKPLPFREPNRLCLLTESMPNIPTLGPSWENFQDWRAQNRSFEGVGAARIAPMTLTGAGEPERLQAQMLSADLLPLLGVSTVQGRPFSAEEDKPGGAPVVLLGHGFWQRRFAGRDVIGRSITIDNVPRTVIGILPEGFRLMQPADVFVPFGPWAAKLPQDRSWHPGIIAIGRLRSDASVQSAGAELKLIMQRLEKQYPEFNTGVGANVTGLHDQLVQNVRPALLALSGAVGLVLLIACANVASLLLARAVSRRREIAVRTALGAAAGRLAMQLLSESIVLAAIGGVAGLALAGATLPWLTKLSAGAVPDLAPIQIDGRVLAFSIGATLLAGLLFGIAPAAQAARTDLRSVLNESARGSTGAGRQSKIRQALVVAEMAIALMLLIGAGLLMRSFDRLQSIEPGFRATNLLIGDVPLSPQAHKDAAERMAFFDRLLERVRTMPGVESAGAAAALPVSGGGSIIHFNIQGRPPKTAHEYVMAGYRPVSPSYLQTLNVPLIGGRYLSDRDNEQGPFAVVVNKAMERQFFPGESALGKFIQLGATPEKDVPWMQIVGVVGDMKQNLATDPAAEFYIPFREGNAVLPVFALSYVVRTSGDPRSATPALREAVRSLDPNQPLVRVRTMEENISASISAPRFRTVLLGIFAFSALTLSVVGLYGVMAYSVAQRVQEIGIRMTLGAQSGDVLRMVLANGLRLAAIGAAVGIAGAIAVSRVLTNFLYGVTALDVWTYAGVTAILIAVAALASFIPARRAVRVDPVVALRSE